jgi:hypothetical protein
LCLKVISRIQFCRILKQLTNIRNFVPCTETTRSLGVASRIFLEESSTVNKYEDKKKGKAIPLHAMEALGGRGV